VGDATSDVRWLTLAADLVSQAPAPWPVKRIARQLTDTFGAACCAFHSRASDGSIAQGLWPPELFTSQLDAICRWSAQGPSTNHPVLRYYLGPGDGRVTLIDDVPERVAPLRLLAAWVECGRDWGGAPGQLALLILVMPRAHRAFVVGRGDSFTPIELDFARQLHRLLSGLDRYVAADPRRADTPGRGGVGLAQDLKLTPRELAVLALLAEDLTAASIGRKLRIAERTVHKHLERTYAKLGVADRLGAVLRAQRIGLLPAR
jgi:DNA-binding CsgD family transcriptional regulator